MESLGRVLGERWKFPSHLIDAIAGHHNLGLAPAPQASAPRKSNLNLLLILVFVVTALAIALVPLAVMAVVSLATPGRIPRGTARTMVRLHAPEALSAHLGEQRPPGQ